MSSCEEVQGVGNGHQYCLGCKRLQDGGGVSRSHDFFFRHFVCEFAALAAV